MLTNQYKKNASKNKKSASALLHYNKIAGCCLIAVIAVESAVKCSLVLKGMQTRQKGQYNAELTLSPPLCVKPLITATTAIGHFQEENLKLGCKIRLR